MQALMTTELPFPRRAGKVRDVYDLGEQLLIVATDRISAYDVIMPTPIPGKGKILTSLSLFWFGYLSEFANHLIATDTADFPAELAPFAGVLRGRSMLVRKTKVIPVECVARGYLAGSGWKEYRRDGTVCGIPLEEGLVQCGRLPSPIFTPATKAEEGHDENISFAEMVSAVGQGLAEDLRSRTLGMYGKAAEFARTKGILLADTKFEFGRLADGSVIVIDEVLTPDSSRFWSAQNYRAGQDQESFDKQFLRNWLEASTWGKVAPAPALPPEIVAGTLARYQEAHERITGKVCEL
jgi:phosphoribosylaminoimidazole-succinocarboxamide synthase